MHILCVEETIISQADAQAHTQVGGRMHTHTHTHPRACAPSTSILVSDLLLRSVGKDLNIPQRVRGLEIRKSELLFLTDVFLFPHISQFARYA